MRPREVRRRFTRRPRRGATTIDYVLLLAVILPGVGFCFWAAPYVMNLVYEMTCVLVTWPFG